MLIACCLNCGSENVRLDCTEKYLVCNDCKERVYIRDLELGLIEKSEKLIRNSRNL